MNENDKKTEKTKQKPKFTLSTLLHRTRVVQLTADVVIDGEVEKEYKVGWVTVRGAQDPEYLEQAAEFAADFREKIEALGEDISADQLREETKLVVNASVACAIVNWDEDLFESKFSLERAMEIFANIKYNPIYNQIAVSIQSANDFLPSASQTQEIG
jgi:hypothetical protein